MEEKRVPKTQEDLQWFMNPYSVGSEGGLPYELSDIIRGYYNPLEMWAYGKVSNEEITRLSRDTIFEELEDMRARQAYEALDYAVLWFPEPRNVLAWADSVYTLGYRDLALYLVGLYARNKRSATSNLTRLSD